MLILPSSLIFVLFTCDYGSWLVKVQSLGMEELPMTKATTCNSDELFPLVVPGLCGLQCVVCATSRSELFDNKLACQFLALLVVCTFS